MSKRYWIMPAALALAGAFAGSAASPARAQNANSYCLTGGGGELGRCGFPTFEECRAYSSGFGVCVASDRPAWGPPGVATGLTGAPTPQRPRRR